MLRRRLMLMTKSLYRWVRTIGHIVMGSRAKAEAAQGADGESRRAARIGRRMAGHNHPVKDVVITRSVQAGRDITAHTASTAQFSVARAMRTTGMRLSSYGVCLITVIREFVVGRKTNAEKAPGADGVSNRSVRVYRKIVSQQADAELVSLRRGARSARYMGVYDAPGASAESCRAAKSGVVAGAERADAESFITRRGMGTGNKSVFATWGDPEMLDDGSLFIRQAYHAEMVDGVLEVI